MINLTSEIPHSENHFETKLQAKFDKYYQCFKQQQQQQELDFKGENNNTQKYWKQNSSSQTRNTATLRS